MKKEDLDKVFKIYDNLWEINEMARILEKTEERERMEFEFTYYYDGIGSERGKKILDEFLRCILNQIKESGLYEEFIHLGMQEYKRAFIYIMKVETEFPISIARHYVEEKGLTDESVDLVIATGDVDFIKECAENPKMKSNWRRMADLIAATKESEYIQNFIKNELSRYFSEYSNGLNIDTNKVWKMIAATEDDEYILECLENPPFGISIYDENAEKAILKIKDVEMVYRTLKKYFRTF